VVGSAEDQQLVRYGFRGLITCRFRASAGSVSTVLERAEVTQDLLLNALASAIDGALLAPDVTLASARLFVRGCGGLRYAAGDKTTNTKPHPQQMHDARLHGALLMSA
jgi:hypothetical protein